MNGDGTLVLLAVLADSTNVEQQYSTNDGASISPWHFHRAIVHGRVHLSRYSIKITSMI